MITQQVRKTERTDADIIGYYGRKGFLDGYMYLKKKVHPLHKDGSKPNCPFIPSHGKRNNFAFNARQKYLAEFVRGFNEYITDKKLDYPLITLEMIT